ncbi:hypothetical protein AAV94_05440 [Lampropedia cohaerens]|uniref:5-formyltetrahydrofolate cyclo-ligase n=1 Tax=Lampropedia cohaerens TaxID=1610491 RepID=A0A0U1Q0T7_9BURK|nr:5-formyltetrahydrofolate cyclo-ligase [Lampropedia cohaerens]KKW68356.1 hypothetical protein AAV94_05440 [Lampropedia cohaerens]
MVQKRRVETEVADAQLRHGVWEDLAAVARPDSRFHLRFTEFIPDFAGAADAVERLVCLPDFARATHVFLTPDNSLTGLRQRCLEAGISVVVSSYDMARGFFHFPAGSVPRDLARYAAWLDGLEHFAKPVSLAELAALGRFDWVVTGAAAVATSGVRFGRGHGWFDLEWRLFGELGLVDARTPIATLVHDVQVLEQPLFPAEEDIPVDVICTPSRTLQVPRVQSRPRRIDWARISQSQIQAAPALRELRQAQGLSAPQNPSS